MVGPSLTQGSYLRLLAFANRALGPWGPDAAGNCAAILSGGPNFPESAPYLKALIEGRWFKPKDFVQLFQVRAGLDATELDSGGRRRQSHIAKAQPRALRVAELGPSALA